jgi:glycerate dehydrogenase
MRIVLLDSYAADQGQPEVFWQGFHRLGEVAIYPRTAAEDILTRARGATAIIINKVVVDAATLAALPELGYVGVLATGVNVVDLAAARAAGVAVTNVPGYSSESVAQLVFALIFAFTHDVAGHAAAVAAGQWAASPDYCFFRQPLTELADKTLVVVGSGAIGNAVARIGEAFGMRVLRAAVPGSLTTAARTPLAECLAAGDIVSLHCPLTDTTRGLVDERFLAAMKADAILLNTGRGPLIDEAALVAALDAGRLRGVGLDVLSSEPPPADHPLIRPEAPWARRVVITPHIGWGTVEARHRLAAAAVDNLVAFLAGHPRNRVA